MKKLKLLIADDHTLFRKGLKQLILNHDDVEKVDEASTGSQVIKMVGKCDYDCLVLDLQMPGRCGLEILKQVKCIKPGLPVVILTMFPEEHYGVRALKAGAHAYLTKTASPQDLMSSLYKVVHGKKHITQNLANELVSNLETDCKSTPHKCLTDRELQVLALIASGKTVSQIAGELSLSAKTVSTHRAKILQKMRMENSAQLTHYAVKNDLVF